MLILSLIHVIQESQFDWEEYYMKDKKNYALEFFIVALAYVV